MANTEKPTANDAPDEKTAILSLLDRWRVATKAKNVVGLLELVTDDVVFLPSSIPPINGKQKVQELYRTFFLQHREINHNAVVEEIQVAGAWAFLWGTDELHLLPDSGEPPVHLKGKGTSNPQAGRIVVDVVARKDFIRYSQLSIIPKF